MRTSASDGEELSLADRAYLALREGIIGGRYPIGSRLRERELSAELQVSRVPVREAIAQLEAEGLVVTQPRRGAVVRQLTLEDVDELFDVRLSLEVLAARLAAEQVRAGTSTDRLRELMATADRVTRAGDEQAIREANTALHLEIVTLSGNRLLGETMAPLVGRIRWLFALTADRDPAAQCREHHELCAAIEAGKPELAEALAYSHIELGRVPSLTALAERLPRN
ncbi:GntR family transcriptional regulator [Kribbella sp. NPDC004536]|uniref:GntR family transcriptional regulator n=1 Tax=Kribbella sp. NPDC004536 TaxID=3364106 RepID=UPI00369B41EB